MNPIDIVRRFRLPGEPIDVCPLGNGHINETLLVRTRKGNAVLQRINTAVFRQPEVLMENIRLVTEHLRKKGERVLHFLPAEDGRLFLHCGDDYWRVSLFCEHTVCMENASEEGLFCAAKAFGSFQRQLCDFDVSLLNETLPGFHDTPARFRTFCRAAEEDRAGRLALARPEVDKLLQRENLSRQLTEAYHAGNLPLRVAHNDTKLNNVLLDEATLQPACVIDLDTVMPGFSVTDFGDSVRFGATDAAEDEQELAKVHFNSVKYAHILSGYLEGYGGILQPEEEKLLPMGAKVITYEQALRFLTDYLRGDLYYKTAYPAHNLVRARTQLRLLEEMEERL